MAICLGISGFYHDSAASLSRDGKILAASSEERFTRIKNDHNFPSNAIKYCLQATNTKIEDIDSIIFYDKPLLKLDRLIETVFSAVPFGLRFFCAAFPEWAKSKAFQKIQIINKLSEDFNCKHELIEKKLHFSYHHLSHAASAFYPSPFEEALVLTVDGVGEWNTLTIGIGKQNYLKIKKVINYPHSLGLLYSAFTYHCGFKINSGEYKLMGLAPYGTPRFKNIIYDNLIDVKEDGSFRLNIKFFDFQNDLKMTNKKFSKIFGVSPRDPSEKEFSQDYKDLAASIQTVLEEILIKLVSYHLKEYNQKNLCFAGGVALNCVANGKIESLSELEGFWIQPNAGDAGASLGAALVGEYLIEEGTLRVPIHSTKDMALGAKFSEEEIEFSLKKNNLNYLKLDKNNLTNEIAADLSQNRIIGLFYRNAEFGPRALGFRSILANPDNENIKEIINSRVKFRESFRPFAPIVLEADLDKYYLNPKSSPFMLKAYSSHETSKKEIPGVIHIDGSSRVQSINEEDHPLLFQVISNFKEITQSSVILNTSFNTKDEPIVNSPDDAIKTFLHTGLDTLYLENFKVTKENSNG